MIANPLEEGLVCEDHLPLSWVAVDALPSKPQLTALNLSNEALVRACEGLEETHRPTEESPELAHELARLDAKMNLVLELLGDWLLAQGKHPVACDVRFNASGIEWSSLEGPEPQTLAKLSVYVCAALPKPMVIYGQVVSREAAADGVMRTVVRFEGVSDSLRDGLERLIFRRHRREVAQLKGR
ncbi:MAG: PilZ domain-containing protein [Thioalkalivibrio sp.]